MAILIAPTIKNLTEDICGDFGLVWDLPNNFV